jgi:hypothetical protein
MGNCSLFENMRGNVALEFFYREFGILISHMRLKRACSSVIQGSIR